MAGIVPVDPAALLRLRGGLDLGLHGLDLGLQYPDSGLQLLLAQKAGEQEIGEHIGHDELQLQSGQCKQVFRTLHDGHRIGGEKIKGQIKG